MPFPRQALLGGLAFLHAFRAPQVHGAKFLVGKKTSSQSGITSSIGGLISSSVFN